MIAQAADAHGLDPVLVGDAAHKGPEPRTNVGGEHRGAIFGAEDAMHVKGTKRVGHGQRLMDHE